MALSGLQKFNCHVGYSLKRHFIHHSTCPSYLSPQEFEILFPTIASLELCGANLIVCRFPLDADNSGVDLHKLGTLDKYSSTLDRIHPNKVLSFHGGRAALRRAWSVVSSTPLPAIGRLTHGAPDLPSEMLGSISHKDNLAVACAQLRPPSLIHDSISSSSSSIKRDNSNFWKSGHLGVDIERKCFNKSPDFVQKFARRVLTDSELSSLGTIDDNLPVNEEIMLLFSLKEAVYKAIRPALGRYVSYKEVEINLQANGTASVVSKLVEPSMKFTCVAEWTAFTPPLAAGGIDEKQPDYWISCVHAFDFSR